MLGVAEMVMANFLFPKNKTKKSQDARRKKRRRIYEKREGDCSARSVTGEYDKHMDDYGSISSRECRQHFIVKYTTSRDCAAFVMCVCELQLPLFLYCILSVVFLFNVGCFYVVVWVFSYNLVNLTKGCGCLI